MFSLVCFIVVQCPAGRGGVPFPFLFFKTMVRVSLADMSKHQCACSISGGQKMALESLELDLQRVIRFCVSVGN